MENMKPVRRRYGPLLVSRGTSLGYLRDVYPGARVMPVNNYGNYEYVTWVQTSIAHVRVIIIYNHHNYESLIIMIIMTGT